MWQSVWQSGREEWITLTKVGNKHQLCDWNVEEFWGCCYVSIGLVKEKMRYVTKNCPKFTRVCSRVNAGIVKI